jgi:YVTN family beta-propeller protein
MKYLMITRIRTALGDSLLHAAVSGLMLAGVAAALFSESPAKAQPGQPAGSLINPAGIAFNPASRKVYAVDTARNQVEIARAGEPGTQRVAVGAAPIALAINAHTNRIFVANAGDGTVSVIDGTGDQVTSRLQVGPRPYSIAVNAATGRVYLTHTFSDDLTVIDEATLAVRQVRPGSRDLIVIDEEANTVYLLGYEGPQMTVMDGVTESFQLRPTGGHIWGAAMDRQGTLYIARIGSNELAIIARGAKSPSTLPTGEMPCAVALDEDAGKAYVANYAAGSVTVMDLKQGGAVATLEAGDRPQAVALDPPRHRLFVANTHQGKITVIDTAIGRPLAQLDAGASPYAFVVAPGADVVYVANQPGGMTAVSLKTLPAA